MEEKEIGAVVHYFGKVSVGIIALTDVLKVGDTVHIKGHTSDFSQSVDSMEIEHQEMQEGKPGDQVGIKVSQKVHEHDKVYKEVA